MTAVHDPCATILDLLDRLCGLHRSLLANATQQRQALLDANVARLGILTREMELLTGKVERLEAERLCQVRLLTGDDAAAASWQALEPRFADRAPRLHLLRDELLGLLHEVRSINDGNAALVHQAQGLGERWGRLLRGLLPATYDARGVLPTSRPTRRAWSA